MPDELRRRQRQEMPLHGFRVELALIGGAQQLLRAGEDVLIGERRRRIDAVHDDVGAVSGEPLVEHVRLQRLRGRGTQHLVHQAAPHRRVREELHAARSGQVRGEEDVPPDGLHLDVADFRAQLGGALLRLGAGEPGDDQRAGGEGSEPARHRHANEPTAA